MGFEVFNRRSAARIEDPWITLQARGNFSMNESAARLIAGGGDPDQVKVELLYDGAARSVGFRMAVDNPNPYIMRRQGTGKVFIVAGRAFTEYYGIDTTQARRFVARKFDDSIIGFGLDDRTSEVSRPGRKKGDVPADPSNLPGGVSG